MITLKPATELKVGDVFSTDGGIVRYVEKHPHTVHVVVCHGTEKTAYLAPDFPCPIWTPDTIPTVTH